MRSLTDTTAKICLGLIVMILALVPFHALLTVWFASSFGHYTALRLWKEALLVLLTIGVLYLLLRARAALWQKLWQHTLIRRLLVLIGLYAALHVIAAAFAWLRGDVSAAALGYGLLSNSRYLVFFVATLAIGAVYGRWLLAHWKYVLLLPAVIVVGFGLLQEFVLPYDVLRHLGYGPDTIKPFILVDEKSEYLRLQSTLRGPNPLGAYLVIILAACAALLFARSKKYLQLTVATGAGLLVMYGTYSRSAWIGLALALGVLVWLYFVRTKQTRKIFYILAALACVICLGAIVALRDNDHVQNIAFHTDETSQSATSSNEGRANAIMGGLRDIANQPFGGGPGVAGPASVHNTKSPARVSENYFIQLGQEVGIVGLAVFVVICVTVAQLLWRLRDLHLLPRVLLASLVGISAINLLSHAWADDTLAYIWWGVAGMVIGALLFDRGRKGKNGKTHPKH